MEEFVQIYENNRKEAVDIFFLPNFEEVFLQESQNKGAVSQPDEESF